MKFNVLVIGAGGIAQGYDEPVGPKINTHIKAYKYYPNFFNVSAICEPDDFLSKKVCDKWQISDRYREITDIKDFKYEVVSVCSPDNTHKEYIKTLVKYKPKVIIAEKPSGLSYEETDEIHNYCRSNGILLIINYIRLFFVDFQNIRNFIISENLKILNVDIKYHKGISHNGSHLLNLLMYLVPSNVVEVNQYSSLVDYETKDPSISFCARMLDRFANVFYLNTTGFSSEMVNILEMDLIFDKYRFIYRESLGGKIEVYRKTEYFSGIKLKEFVLEKNINLDYSNAFLELFGFVVQFLQNGTYTSFYDDIEQSYLNTSKIFKKIEHE